MENKPKRRSYDKVTDKAVNWIAQMWPIMVCIVGLAFHSGMAKSNIHAELKEIRIEYKFEMQSISDNVKRNELRTARLESSIINSESKLSEIDKKIDNFVSELKYVYPTKNYVDGELKKKADRKELDSRNFKKAYRED